MTIPKTPHVAVLVDTATGWGRRLVQGIVNYGRSRGPWYLWIKSGGQQAPLWLPPGWSGDGIIARVGTPAAARQSTDTLAVDDPDLASAVAFIRSHATDPIQVKDVLRAVAVSRRWLERRFREVLGRGPGAEIRRVRLARAEPVLTHGRSYCEGQANVSPTLARSARTCRKIGSNRP
jgi:AraC-like DNA-binding protein